MKSVLVIEPEAVTRGLLAELVFRRMGFGTVYEASSQGDAQRLFKQHKPSFVLMEILGTHFSGSRFLREVKPHKETHILILSSVQNPALLSECIHLGAQGFVSKHEDLTALRQAVQVVCNGGGYFSPLHSQFLRQAILGSPLNEHPLTLKEREIISLVAQSHSNKSIASSLNLSIKTVENHRARIMRKLRLHDIASLTRYAIAAGFIPSTV